MSSEYVTNAKSALDHIFTFQREVTGPVTIFNGYGLAPVANGFPSIVLFSRLPCLHLARASIFTV